MPAPQSLGQQKLDALRGLAANLAPTLAPYVAPVAKPTTPVAPTRPPVTYAAGSSAAPAPAPSGPGNLTVGEATGLSPSEAWIIKHESNGRTKAFNPTVVYDQGKRLGNAWGIGQIVDDRPIAQRPQDASTQLQIFRDYVKRRYGTAEKAQSFWQAHGWY